jgi:chemotaxis protein CheD
MARPHPPAPPDDSPDDEATPRKHGASARELGGRRGGYFHNRAFGADTIKVFLGHHAVSDRTNVMMATTLGSCVSACIHDPVRGVGGMNHFLLPDLPESELQGDGLAARYGSVAMERLINALLAQGAERRRLQVKLFGGARVIESSYDIGGMNSRFAINYVRVEGLTLAGQDLGGAAARRIHYFPHSGRALRRMLNPTAVVDTITQERHFMSNLRRDPVEGDVELFTPEPSGDA